MRYKVTFERMAAGHPTTWSADVDCPAGYVATIGATSRADVEYLAHAFAHAVAELRDRKRERAQTRGTR